MEHEKREEELERQADRLDQEADRVERNIEGARSEWESKQQDQQVPGAVRDPEVEYAEERAQEEDEAIQARRDELEDATGGEPGEEEEPGKEKNAEAAAPAEDEEDDEDEEET